MKMMKAERGGERGAWGPARLGRQRGLRRHALDRCGARIDMAMMTKQRFYRLWCGPKRHSPWLADEKHVWERAVRLGLAFESHGSIGMGPLTWIEIGERARSKAKTVTIGRRGKP